MQFHPNDLTLLAILQPASASPPDILEHLKRCSRCRLRLKGLEFVCATPKEDKTDYESVLDRVQERLQQRLSSFFQEQDESEILFAWLMKRSSREQILAVRGERPFQTWSVLTKLIKEGIQRGFQDPEQGEPLLLLALELADNLDSSYYGQARIDDLKARSWTFIGNTRRLRSDWSGAEEAIGISRFYLQRGTGDVMEKARTLLVEASLLRAQREFSLSIKNLDQAIRLYQNVGYQHGIGRALITMSLVRNGTGHPEQSLSLLQKAAYLVNCDREPRLLLCLLHNLVNTLLELDRPQEAQKIFTKLHSLYEQFPGESIQIFRQWIEGKIARGLGRQQEAETFLMVAREGFLAKGRPRESGLISKELMRTGACISH